MASMGTKRLPPVVYDREERARRFGVDCGDELLWEDGTWSPGGEFCKTLVLKNIGNETIKVKYKPPETSFFSMDFPDVISLSPGMSVPVQVVFRPVRVEPYDDYIEFVIRNKKLKWVFYIPIRARLSNVSVSVPEMLDFGFCPISESTKRTFEVKNTGQVPVQYRWETQLPFRIEPTQGTISEAQIFTATYVPIDASVVVSKALFHVNGLDRSPVVFKLSGIGKYPHVTLSEPRIDFGEVLPGATADKEIVLRNQSFVPARFSIRRVERDLPPVFDVRPDVRIIEPGAMAMLSVRFRPTARGQFSCDTYLIETPGGNVAQLELVGVCVGPDVDIGDRENAQSIQFGEYILGSDSMPTRALHLRNNAEKPIRYHFFADPNGEFEFVDPAVGEIPAKLSKAVTLRFHARRVGNYYRRLFCVIENQLPLYFDLIGTCYDDSIEGKANRPQPLLARHLIAHRKRELAGLDRETPEHLVEVAKDRELRGEDETSSGLEIFPEDDQTVACSGGLSKGQLEVCEQLFKRRTSTDSVIVLDSDELDFGASSAMSASTEKKIFRVVNRHHAKVTCSWTVNWKASDGAKVQPPFAIFPESQDIAPGRAVEFRVHFRPSMNNTYFFATASAYVHLKSNRTFRLVKDQAFIPPWFLSIRMLGHTFQPGIEHFLPKVRFVLPETTLSTTSQSVKTSATSSAASTGSQGENDQILSKDVKSSYWHSVDFPVCHLGESALQTLVIENNGDTPVRFEFGEDPTEIFSVMPRVGQIERGQFQLVALKTSPVDVGEHKFLLKCKLNCAVTNTHTLALSSFCGLPDVEVTDAQSLPIDGEISQSIEGVFIKPTSLGLRSQRQVAVKNRSRVPVEFQWRIPKRFRQILSVEPERGMLRGNERTLVTWTFAPSAARKFDMDCVLFSRSIWPSPGILYENRSILTVHATGSTSCVEFSNSQVDLGTVLAQASSERSLGVTNHADCEVEVKFDILGTRQEYLRVSPGSMRIPARATLPIQLTFIPQKCGRFNFVIVCTCLDKGEDSGSGITCKASGSAADPSMLVEDARSTLSPAALWKQLDLAMLNKILRSPVTDAEVEFVQCASVPGMGKSRKDELRELLDCVSFRFTPALHMSPTEHIHLQLKNQGKLPAEFHVQFPNDSDIDIEPWADSRDPCEAELKQAFLLDQRVFEVLPRSGLLGPGEAVTLRISYRHHVLEYGGMHNLEVLLGLVNGKQVRLALEGRTLSSMTPCVFPVARSNMLARQPLGMRDPPVQFVELRNLGTSNATFTVDETALQTLMQENYDFPILRCLTPSGTIQGGGGSTQLEFMFAPLEAKLYKCKLPISVSSELGNFGSAQDAETEERVIVEIELIGEGFHPHDEENLESSSELLMRGQQPPERQKLALPGQLASLSLDLLKYGTVPVGSQISRVVFLRNHTANDISFAWSADHPFIEQGIVRIVPPNGEVAPGEFTICKVILETNAGERPFELDTDLACVVTSVRESTAKDSEFHKKASKEEMGSAFRTESRASSVCRDSRKKRQSVEHQSVVGRSTAAHDQRMKSLNRSSTSEQTLIIDDDFHGHDEGPSGDVRLGTSMSSPRAGSALQAPQRIYIRLQGEICTERDAKTLGDFGHLFIPTQETWERQSTSASSISDSKSASSTFIKSTHFTEENNQSENNKVDMLREAVMHKTIQEAFEKQVLQPPPRFVDLITAKGLRLREAPVDALNTQTNSANKKCIKALLTPSCQGLVHMTLESTLLNLIEEASRGEISLISHQTMLFREE